MKLLTVDQILACPDLVEEVVEVPEWGGSVKVRAFSKAVQQQVRSEARIADEIDDNRLEMLIFLHGVIEPQFSADQYELLRGKSAAAIDRVSERISKLSGLSGGAVDAAKEKFPEKP